MLGEEDFLALYYHFQLYVYNKYSVEKRISKFKPGCQKKGVRL